MLLTLSFLGGACAGLAGMVEVAAVQGRANASVNAGYGYVGILVAFLARQNPAGVLVVSVLLGGLMASGGMLQRAQNLAGRRGARLARPALPRDSVERNVIRPLVGKEAACKLKLPMGASGILLGVAAGAVRGSIPYLFVSLGECLTEKSGKINLGMEGVLLMGAMTAFAVSDHSGSPWLGVAAAAAVGALMGAVHAGLTRFPKVSDIAAGIAMILFGSGLAFFFGKKFVAPMAPQLPLIDLGFWSPVPALHSALRISPLFFFGIALAFLLDFVFRRTRWGLQVRAAGDDPLAARSAGIPVNTVRMTATVLGAALAAAGGAHLTLYFPGIWSEGISGGQGLMAVALVIFARWSPLRCMAAALLFGGAQALGPSLQAVGHRRLLPSLQRIALPADSGINGGHLLAPRQHFRSARSAGEECMTPPAVEVRGLRKRFGAVQALDGVDLRVEPGEFHALIGENGAGKSTLAKCIMGINGIDEGEMLLDGTAWRARNPREARRSGIGMVFQHFTLVPSMTVAENLTLPRPGLPAVIRWNEETGPPAHLPRRLPPSPSI